MSPWGPVLLGIVAAAVAARWAASVALRKAPASLTRVNVTGREVPAVLGWPLLAGALAGALFIGAWAVTDPSGVECGGDRCFGGSDLAAGLFVAVALMAAAAMFLAGLWDDLRGDERPRGFGGHLAAARTGALTGGIVKLVTGVVVSLTTIVALRGWEIPPIADWLLSALPLALSANLINLFDRAPGRALKVFLAVALPLTLLVPSFALVAAGTLGGALAVLDFDLKAEGMLGDAGANPLGLILGLGLVLGVTDGLEDVGGSRPSLLAVTILLLALNLASERWSFSRIIETTPLLTRLDHLGRK